MDDPWILRASRNFYALLPEFSSAEFLICVDTPYPSLLISQTVTDAMICFFSFSVNLTPENVKTGGSLPSFRDSSLTPVRFRIARAYHCLRKLLSSSSNALFCLEQAIPAAHPEVSMIVRMKHCSLSETAREGGFLSAIAETISSSPALSALIVVDAKTVSSTNHWPLKRLKAPNTSGLELAGWCKSVR